MNAKRQICEVCKNVVEGDIPEDFKCPQCENNIFTPCYCQSYPLYLATKETVKPHICTACNYVYEKGDFDQLEDFQCPECGQPKEMFQPCSCVKLAEAFPNQEKTENQGKDGYLTLAGTFTKNHALYEELGLDFCCGGERTIEKACLEQGIDKNLVLKRLEQGEAGEYSTAEILAEIAVHHNYLKESLPKIQALAEKAAAVHAGKYSQFLALFEKFAVDVRVHTFEEDCYFFPLVKEGKIGLAVKILERHRKEHQEVGAALKVFRHLLNEFKAEESDCFTTRTLKQKLAELETDLHLHVGKENHILYPLIEKQLIEKQLIEKQQLQVIS